MSLSKQKVKITNMHCCNKVKTSFVEIMFILQYRKSFLPGFDIKNMYT